jgi:hypothetical protein
MPLELAAPDADVLFDQADGIRPIHLLEHQLQGTSNSVSINGRWLHQPGCLRNTSLIWGRSTNQDGQALRPTNRPAALLSGA